VSTLEKSAQFLNGTSAQLNTGYLIIFLHHNI